ncbi:hypothetical protein L218DRAFT_947154 [Marasmius fiardii PR-910]|nr:hypothetical protein L218DRAFT_947154 [Marasmius fiardii PR-910]
MPFSRPRLGPLFLVTTTKSASRSFLRRLLSSTESWIAVVFVSRPLFIEEHGLKLLLRDSGGIELTGEEYERGDWATKVHEAWTKGKEGKKQRRLEEDPVNSVLLLLGWLVSSGGREKEGSLLRKSLSGWMNVGAGVEGIRKIRAKRQASRGHAGYFGCWQIVTEKRR